MIANKLAILLNLVKTIFMTVSTPNLKFLLW